MPNPELEAILTKLKDTNAIIDPGELVQLIEQVGMFIDDLDLEIIELEQDTNAAWRDLDLAYPDWPRVKVTNEWKVGASYRVFKKQLALLRQLRRHYRLLNTKLNLITKPRGR